MGNITLDDVTIQSNANGGQPAGNITLISPGIIKFIDSQIDSNSNDTSTARAGNIIIDTAHLNLGNASLLSAETSSIDDGGNIIINATESVSLGEGVEDFSPVISVEASGAGRPGNIEINTPNFRLAETARITATSQVTATNQDSGGSVTLNTDRLDLAGTVEILAETEGQSPGGILTLQPYQTNPDLDINLFPKARISASTSGSGPGGTLRLSASENISIHGPGLITALTRGSGPAGTLQVRSQQLTLADGAQLSTSTESIGQGGNIDIATRLLNLDQGTIAVRSTGSGNSGSINLNAQQAMLLRNNSSIETDAGGSLGNGGNIDITTPFLIGLPGENSDIIANAIGGDGGQVNITANNLFNFGLQDGQDRNLLRGNTTNDISASSQTGTSGIITLDTLNVDPAQSLAELPTDLIDASSLIDSSLCAVGNKSEFLVTGRGGLPTSPNDTISATTPWEDWETGELQNGPTLSTGLTSPDNSLPTTQLDSNLSTSALVEAKHWSRTADGKIILHSTMPTKLLAVSCRRLQQQLHSSSSH